MNTLKGKLALYFFSLLISLSTPAAVLYVNVNGSHPVAPYADWSTAATNIQSAVNAANPGDEVLVTNGVYQTGQTSLSGSNRVTVSKAILLQSVNGPAVTVIRGFQVPGVINSPQDIRCVYLVGGAALSGFTLTNGASISVPGGGGVYCQSSNCVVTNCAMAGNVCTGNGGGGYQGIYNRCLIIGNTGNLGGGVAYAKLTNCLLTANSAQDGGGAFGCLTMVNCTVVNNHAAIFGGGVGIDNFPPEVFLNTIICSNTVGNGSPNLPAANVYFGSGSYTVSNCCSPDFPFSTCITNSPIMPAIAFGDYHLQIGSPGIDAGDNAFAPTDIDLDGNPRIVNGTVDMGAFENQYTGIVHYVSLAGKNPTSPYTNWPTAATNIQDAIDAANAGEVVLVSNGLYQVGGRVVYGTTPNRVVINKPITVESLNGPVLTTISGANAMRCAYLTNNACLIGFTLTGGSTANAGDLFQNQSGGGAWSESTNTLLEDCILTFSGAARYGGGAYSGTLENCLITRNNASYGGGAAFSMLKNCTLANNSAGSGISGGGGSAFCTLESCTLSSNSCNNAFGIGGGGGALGGFLSDCTLIGNSSPAGYGGGAISNVLVNCTLSGNWALKDGGGTFLCALTNCALNGNVTTNGNGGGAIYGLLVGCQLNTNLTVNGVGGGTCSNVLNNCFLSGNSANNGGGAAYGTLNGCSLSGNSAQNLGGGAYFGSVMSCRLSGNISAFYGGGTCYANVTNSSITQSGFGYAVAYGICYNCMITNNKTGIYSNSAYGCLISSNQAGASYLSILNNCLLILNGEGFSGSVGVSRDDILNDCTIVYNNGHGTFDSYATNCIIYFNFNSDIDFNFTIPFGAINHCCTSVTNFGSGFFGPGNFTNAPLFQLANPPFVIGRYHPASNSPCIDAGLTSAAVGSADVDGRPRIVNGTVDVGASEFQGAGVEPFIVWLGQYGLPNDGSADFADSDGTGMNNWQKWIAGLNPTNPASVLAMFTVTNTVTGATVSWQSVTGITYFVQSSTNLGGAPAFTSIQSNIVGQAGTTSYTDLTATNGGSYFYRVGVQ